MLCHVLCSAKLLTLNWWYSFFYIFQSFLISTWQWYVWFPHYRRNTGKITRHQIKSQQRVNSLSNNQNTFIVLIYTYAMKLLFYIFRQLFSWNLSCLCIVANTVWHRMRLFIPHHINQEQYWQQARFVLYQTDSLYITQDIQSHQNLYCLTRGVQVTLLSVRNFVHQEQMMTL